MHGKDLADPVRCRAARLTGSLAGSHVAFKEDRGDAAAHTHHGHQFDIRGLKRRIKRLHSPRSAENLNHSQGFFGIHFCLHLHKTFINSYI